jgi:hypothetical protein
VDDDAGASGELSVVVPHCRFTDATHSSLASAGVFPTTRVKAASPVGSSALPSRKAL